MTFIAPPSVFLKLGFLIACLPQTSILNKHLQELMDGLTAKVFRTYNASITLQQQLKELTTGGFPPKLFEPESSFMCRNNKEAQRTVFWFCCYWQAFYVGLLSAVV